MNMTEHEKIRRALAPLHASPDAITEVLNMKTHRPIKRAAAACLAAALALALCSVAYAADLGGIQTAVKIWLNGRQTDATFTTEGDGSYTLTYTGEDGAQHQEDGGGIALEDDGAERPLTADELIALLDDTPKVAYADDGTVTLSYLDQALDITDRFDGDGVCQLELTQPDGSPLYVTVIHSGSLGASTSAYIPADDLR